MKKHDFILGLFMECDLDDNYRKNVENFSERHASLCLLATKSFQLHAFANDQNEDELAEDWKKNHGDEEDPVYFEWIKDPSEWSKRWTESFQVRLKEAVRRNNAE